MNPLFQSILQASTSAQGGGGTFPHPQTGGLNGAFNGVFQRVQQLAQSLQNPQQMVSRYFPDAPADVASNPEQLIGWLQQTGKVNPQMVQMARQMMGK